MRSESSAYLWMLFAFKRRIVGFRSLSLLFAGPQVLVFEIIFSKIERVSDRFLIISEQSQSAKTLQSRYLQRV